MTKLVRNPDSSFDLITDRGVVLCREESYAFCCALQAAIEQPETRGGSFDVTEAAEVAAQLRSDGLV